MRKLTREEFIIKSVIIHGTFYDYSKVNYINNSTKVCIICPIHGEFWMTPNDHMDGHKCPKCVNRFRYTTETFIEAARKVHCDRYDYSKVVYINNKTPVCIICPVHGEFWQRPNNHLSGQGCPSCKSNETFKNRFFKRAREIHGDKYDYSKVEYIDSETPVCIICPVHGEFWQKPSIHLSGHGCPKCGKNETGKKLSSTKECFTIKSKEIHGNKYDYSKVEYINRKTPICIICPIHGEFWQTPREHLSGNGCPKCALVENITENKIYDLISKNFKTEIIRQKEFAWLKNKRRLRIDFYLPFYKIGIEYQGEQHFKPVKYYGGDDKFNKQIENDAIKQKLCKEHGIDILYFTYDKKYGDDVIITDEMVLIDKIKEYG